MKRDFKKTFCLYLASFFSISFIALGISFLFSPQYILLNRIWSVGPGYRNVYNSLVENRHEGIEAEIWSLYSPDDELGLWYLFGGSTLSVDSYISGKEKFDKFPIDRKEVIYNKIGIIMQNDFGASKSELMNDIESVAAFSNEWILDKKFTVYPSGDDFGIFVVMFCVFIPFPVYNFIFYDRYYGYSTRAAKRWNRKMKMEIPSSKEKYDE